MIRAPLYFALSCFAALPLIACSPQAQPQAEASAKTMQAAMQFSLLSVLRRGSCVSAVPRRTETVPSLIPLSSTASLAILYSGMMTTVGPPTFALGC